MRSFPRPRLLQPLTQCATSRESLIKFNNFCLSLLSPSFLFILLITFASFFFSLLSVSAYLVMFFSIAISARYFYFYHLYIRSSLPLFSTTDTRLGERARHVINLRLRQSSDSVRRFMTGTCQLAGTTRSFRDCISDPRGTSWRKTCLFLLNSLPLSHLFLPFRLSDHFTMLFYTSSLPLDKNLKFSDNTKITSQNWMNFFVPTLAAGLTDGRE